MNLTLRLKLRRHRQIIDGHWIWDAAHDKAGYGVMGWQGRTQRVHRLAWLAWKGRIPEGLCVLHRCDIRPCFNPKCLFLGTYRDNNADMTAKGRNRNQNSSKTHCQQGHELTPENTQVSREGWRSCRTCHRQWSRDWRARNRVG
jgi:hypothetical protein